MYIQSFIIIIRSDFLSPVNVIRDDINDYLEENEDAIMKEVEVSGSHCCIVRMITVFVCYFSQRLI